MRSPKIALLIRGTLIAVLILSPKAYATEKATTELQTSSQQTVGDWVLENNEAHLSTNLLPVVKTSFQRVRPPRFEERKYIRESNVEPEEEIFSLSSILRNFDLFGDDAPEITYSELLTYTESPTTLGEILIEGPTAEPELYEYDYEYEEEYPDEFEYEEEDEYIYEGEEDVVIEDEESGEEEEDADEGKVEENEQEEGVDEEVDEGEEEEKCEEESCADGSSAEECNEDVEIDEESEDAEVDEGEEDEESGEEEEEDESEGCGEVKEGEEEEVEEEEGEEDESEEEDEEDE